MYFNPQPRWAAPSASFSVHFSIVRIPVQRNLLIVLVLFIGILFAGTSVAVNAFADKQVGYQPKNADVNLQAEKEANNPYFSSGHRSNQAVAVSAAEKDTSTNVQAILDAWAGSHLSQKWSVVVQGLGSDKTQASINGAVKYDPASVFKLYFTYTLFQRNSLDSLANNFVNVDGRGSVNMKGCLDLMIKNSDNPCGVAMGNRLGWGKTTKALKNLGILNTDLNNPSGLTTTAADVNTFLQKLSVGQLMPQEDQQYLLNLMQQQRYRSGIPAGCNGCVIADKTGDLGFVRHDVAIVQYPGGSYTLAIMTNGASYSQIAQLTSQIQAAISS
jgi:hypothetical protein